MPFGIVREQAVVASLLTLFVCRAVLVSATVPPWQGPDEPEHFVLARLLTIPERTTQPARPELEKQVLQSMAKYRWWEPYGVPTPDPLPTAFRQIPRLGAGSYGQPLYYGLGSAVLRGTQPVDLEAAYGHLRALSVMLSVVALALGWCGTRLLFGPAVAIGATSIAIFHPQFLLSAITVNPDALATLLGAFMWWQVARSVRGHRPGMSLMLLVVAAVAVLLTKRSAVPLGVVAMVIVAASMFAPRTVRITRRSLLLVVTALGACLVLAVSGWLVFEGPIGDLPTYWRNALRIRRPTGATMFPEGVAYARESIDYVWLMAGWLRFPAPEPWLWVARSLTVVGLAGAAVLLIRAPVLRRPLSIAWLFVMVQGAVVIGWGFLALTAPQGRYLFPVIAPATALLWLGLTHATPARLRPYAAPALISVLAIMDVTGFTTVLIPAYVPW